MSMLSLLIILSMSRLLPLSIGIVKFRRFALQLKILFALVCISMLFDAVESMLTMHGLYNHWLFRFYSAIECLLLLAVFYLWEDRPRFRTLLRFALPVFLAFWIAGRRIAVGIFLNADPSLVLECLRMIAIAVYTMGSISLDPDRQLLGETQF